MVTESLPYASSILYLRTLQTIIPQINYNRSLLIFLDSCSEHEFSFPREIGRYSFIAFDPLKTYKLDDAVISHKTFKRSLGEMPLCIQENRESCDDPFAYFDLLSKQLQKESLTNLPPFQGGFCGYFSYELGEYIEKLPLSLKDSFSFGDLVIGLFDTVIAFDHEKKEAFLFSHGMTPALSFDEDLARERASFFKRNLLNHLEKERSISSVNPAHSSFLRSNFSKSEYEEKVEEVRECILDGEIFQANLSRRISGSFETCPLLLDLYQKQREENPAPFSAFMYFENKAILSSSPERFLKIDYKWEGKTKRRQIETRPIKGTRRRNANAKLDAELARDLVTHPKDQSENLMIVDLLRNDLSKICKPFSVHVPTLFSIESYATVHQMVSIISGELEDEATPFQVLTACFPGGSITGAPKIRAQEILRELEKIKRGPYCGALGYIGFDGAMDTSIIIRTLMVEDERFYFQVGGGIVWDSSPEAEYDETEAKAQSFYTLLRK